jgi:hypothetical protein
LSPEEKKKLEIGKYAQKTEFRGRTARKRKKNGKEGDLS